MFVAIDNASKMFLPERRPVDRVFMRVLVWRETGSPDALEAGKKSRQRYSFIPRRPLFVIDERTVL